MSKQIGLSFNYSAEDLNDGIFRYGPRRMENRIRAAFAERGVEVHTIDLVDPNSPDTLAVIYFDFNWRHWLNDKYLKSIPFEKRVLVYVEPANINPTAYYIPFFRNHFSKVFTYDEILLKKNPSYIPHTVLPFGELDDYHENRYVDIPFSDKKLLCSISRNRWSYMPQSTYGFRKKAYHWFCKHEPKQFDLYGSQWNEPITWYQKLLGYPKFQCYRGSIDGPYARKMDVMAHYKFALCFENNVSRPGYISEKIRDCFCSRTVPVYYGSLGVEKHIPIDCFINMREFNSFADLDHFLNNMHETEYSRRVLAIDSFINSSKASYFSSDRFVNVIVSNVLVDSAK